MDEKEYQKLEKGKSKNQSFEHLLKVETKAKMKSYEGEVEAKKFNHWLQWLEVYFKIKAMKKLVATLHWGS